jgi:soluble lytic murein transglycosylase
MKNKDFTPYIDRLLAIGILIVTLCIVVLIRGCNVHANDIYYVNKYCDKYEIDRRIIISLINVESDGKNSAISHKGCYGLMQVSIIAYKEYYNHIAKTKPKTAKYFLTVPKKMKAYYLKNPERNIRIGTWYYKYCLKRAKGNTILALHYYIMGFDSKKIAWGYLNKILMGVIK